MTDSGQSSNAARQAARSQQAALAEFGQFALGSDDLQAILEQACILVTRGLEVPIGKALQTNPGNQDLLIRAAVGLPPHLVRPGETRVPGNLKSSAGYAIRTGQPVISDTATETRFEVSELVRRSGVRSSANVPIGTADAPFGVLEVDSREPREFTDDDLHFLKTYANLVAAAVQRQRSGALLDALAREREVLLRELQHRIKNDLQVITALLMLESRQSNNVETRARLDGIGSRVEALRLIHERLFAGNRFGEVELNDYLGELCRSRFSMHALDPAGDICLVMDLAPVAVKHDLAVSIGLIVNEFLTNSLKHAFPMGRGLVSVSLAEAGDGGLRLVLADSGIGARRRTDDPGMGLRLIEMIGRQVDAAHRWSDEGGTRLELDIPAKSLRP